MNKSALRLGILPLLALSIVAILGSGAEAAGSKDGGPTIPGNSCPVDSPNPFRGVELSGLVAVQRINWPGTPCTIRVWKLELAKEIVSQPYEGGVFYLYTPGVGQVGGFLLGDIMHRTVNHPGLVSFHNVTPGGRTEVRYGDPDYPDRARVVAYVNAHR